MKKSIIVLLVLITTFCSAQKMYKFNYAIETEITFYKEDSITKKVIYLTNSKDNSYFVELTSKDSLHYNLVFKHHDKLSFKGIIQKSQLKNAEFISIDCNGIDFQKNIYKNATKRYDFFRLKDTIVNNKNYAAYKLKSILNFKKRKRRGAGTNLYIIDNLTNFHLPFLTHPTAYEEWKLYKNLPNGLFIEKKHINVYNEEHSSEKLIGYNKIDRKIIITDKCNGLE